MHLFGTEITPASILGIIGGVLTLIYWGVQVIYNRANATTATIAASADKDKAEAHQTITFSDMAQQSHQQAVAQQALIATLQQDKVSLTFELGKVTGEKTILANENVELKASILVYDEARKESSAYADRLAEEIRLIKQQLEEQSQQITTIQDEVATK